MNPYLRVLLALLVIALVSGCCLSWTAPSGRTSTPNRYSSSSRRAPRTRPPT